MITSNAAKDRSHGSKAGHAYDVLKQALIRCELAPGLQTTELALAERCGLSRAAVRAALSRLQQEGWFQVVPRKGYLVQPIVLKDVRDLFAVRVLVEPAAAELAAGSASDAQLRKLEGMCEAPQYQREEPESIHAALEANTRFHVMVASSSGNDRLARILADLHHEMQRLFYLGLWERSVDMSQGHIRLVEALARRDGAEAATVARDQVMSTRQMVTDAIFENPDFGSVNLVRNRPEPQEFGRKLEAGQRSAAASTRGNVEDETPCGG